MGVRRKSASEAEIMARVRVDDAGCWIWVGARKPRPNGRHSPVFNRTSAVKLSFEAFIGAVPDDFVVSCRHGNNLCVNPHHMDMSGTSAAQVMALGKVQEKALDAAKKRTSCKRGHLWSEHAGQNNKGQRICLACAREKRRLRRSDVASGIPF